MIIKDIKILNSLKRKYKIQFDKYFKYITSPVYETPDVMYLNGVEYIVKYYDGCFNPFVIKGREKLNNSGSALYHEGINYYNFKDIKGATLYYLDNMTPEAAKKLLDKYYNIKFLKGASEYAPELKFDILKVYNKEVK